MTIGLRAVVPTDAPLLAAMHREWDEPWDERAFATLLGTPGVFGILAGENQPPARAAPERAGADALAANGKSERASMTMEHALGFILCRIAADEAEVLTLFVPEASRRKGVATALLDRAVAHARAAQAAALFLEVSEANAAARALYAGLGFSEVGRRTRYYQDGADALVLKQEIAHG